ncbi:MAG: Protein of unknown function metallopeptidase-related protein [Firmicutes bacterium]|nr:Protein of unknown function metallopeptidase-related protein [Bacillota bacterium]
METYFEVQSKELYEKAHTIITNFLAKNRKAENSKLTIPDDFTAEFFHLVDKVNLSLMEDTDNFYGYFLFQMARELRFDISSPTAVNFKGAKYVIYFNPIIFLTLTLKQMETTIKHEILHIISLHVIRAKESKAAYSQTAINMAMDIVVNTFLDHLPPYATTLEAVNANYDLKLLPFESFEYYADKLQTAIDLLDEGKAEIADDTTAGELIETIYNPEKTHDLWEASHELEEKTLTEFTEKFIAAAQKGSIPHYLDNLLAALKNSQAELPWNLYLKRLMGTVASEPKKAITRRNRRQPERLDLRGQLRSHKAKIAVALDISGSITDEEFYQAIKEVITIVKNYRHEITIIECDSEVRRSYQIQSAKDIKPRLNIRGGTRFTPVFEYANNSGINLLVYFTDGKGEDKLLTKPRGYKALWVISGRGDKLSLKEPFGAVKKLNAIEIKDIVVDMNDVKIDGYSMNDQERLHI